MTSACLFVAVLLLAGTPQVAHAQGLSPESMARAVRDASHQLQTAPIARRGHGRAPTLLPILIGAGIGGGLGVVVAHRSEAPVQIPISMAVVGAAIGWVFSSSR
jgi:hypothetical protein